MDGNEAGLLPISAFVICKNEEAFIEGCLESLAGCREIVVVDSGSTDRTLAIVAAMAARGLPIRLIHQDWLGFARQKAFALQQGTQPWLLNLDADERLDPALRADLARLTAAPPNVAGWRFRRLPALGPAGRPPRGVHPTAMVRLVRRGARYDETALVHEGLRVEGALRTARAGLILHVRHLTVGEQIRKELGYATLKASERVEKGRPPSVLKLVGNPVYHFFRLFVLHRWFLCGRVGFVHAATGAIYAFATEAVHFDQLNRMV